VDEDRGFDGSYFMHSQPNEEEDESEMKFDMCPDMDVNLRGNGANQNDNSLGTQNNVESDVNALSSRRSYSEILIEGE